MKPFICSLLSEIPRLPVITNEGYTYDFVSLARKLLQENIEPNTGNKVTSIIYNRSIKNYNDDVLSLITRQNLLLTNKEKTEIAWMFAKLICRYPELKISGIPDNVIKKELTYVLFPRIPVQKIASLIVTFFDDTLENLGFGSHCLFDKLVRGERNIYQAVRCWVTSTPLHHAVSEQRLDIVRILLNYGADLAFTEMINGIESPLFLAAVSRNFSIVFTLLAHGADCNWVNSKGETALFVAAENGDLSIVEILLLGGAELDLARFDQITPLIIAAKHGHADVVDALLIAGADPASAKIYDEKELLYATRIGDSKVVRAWLSIGIDPKKTKELLYTAILYHHFEVALMILGVSLVDNIYSSYSALVQFVLSDEHARYYYLKQIILNPDLMRDAFNKNAIFFNKLCHYRKELWTRLKKYSDFNLSLDVYITLLKTIMDSNQKFSSILHHPLNIIFNKSQRAHSTRFHKYDRSIFFDIQNTICEHNNSVRVHAV